MEPASPVPQGPPTKTHTQAGCPPRTRSDSPLPLSPQDSSTPPHLNVTSESQIGSRDWSDLQVELGAVRACDRRCPAPPALGGSTSSPHNLSGSILHSLTSVCGLRLGFVSAHFVFFS